MGTIQLKIKLTKNYECIVDDDIDQELLKIKWYSSHSSKTIVYARNIRKGYLHRLIMGNPKGRLVDHINGNTLDNRKCNLRICNNTESIRNRDKTKSKSSSKYIGVSYNKKTKNWRAHITLDYKYVQIGTFDTEEQAYRARKEVEKEYFGDFVRKK